MQTIKDLAPLRVWRHFWHAAKRHRLFWIAAILCVAFAQATIIASSFVFKHLIDDAVRLSNEFPRDERALTARLLELTALWAAMWVAWRSSGVLVAQAQTRTERDLLVQGFQGVIERSYRFFENSFVGALSRRIRRYGDAFSTIAEQVMWTMIPTTITLVGGTYALWTTSPLIAKWVIVWLMVYLVANVAFSAWKLKYDEERAERDSHQTAALADAVTNYHNVVLFNGQTQETNAFYQVSEQARLAHVRSWYLTEVNFGVQSLLLSAMEIAALLYVIKLWAQGNATIGDVALVHTVFSTMSSNLWEVGRLLRHIFEAVGNAKETVDILEEPLEIQDTPQATILPRQKGEIVYQNVDFSYGGKHVLNGLNIIIRPGERVAFVGPSGAGKSTVVKLLMRLYDVTGGAVLVNGQDIREVSQSSLREAISLVPQDPVLFHRSIKDNIRYAKPNATDEEIIQAATRARCHDFIMRLPQGYDTFVGERGVKLSGGERQRIAIARAMLRESPILVLDEATSSLDSASEALIQEALLDVMREKTTIVIAHRLSTVMQMDRILVVDHGRIVDEGTHTELSERNGIYKHLWDIQVGGYQAHPEPQPA